MSAKLKLVEDNNLPPAGVLDAALEVARRRADTLRQLRDALKRGDDALALSIARKVVGLDAKGNRAVKS